MNRFLVLLFIMIASPPAFARVFSFKDSNLGVMLRGSGGTSSVGKDPYGDSSGSDTTIVDETKYNYSGELGLVLGMGSSFNLRIGSEIIQHHPVKEGHGLNPGGIERFQLESSTFVFNPNIAAEIFFEAGATTRFFAQLGLGYAMVDVANRYTMTATGTSELGVNDFNEKMSGTGISAMVGAGLETFLLDNVTLSLDAGYRYIQVSELKYSGDVNNIVRPTGALKGEAALNTDGSKRELNLGGVFVGASLRFYQHFL